MSHNNTLLHTVRETLTLRPQLVTRPAPALVWHETSEFKSFLRSLTADPPRPASPPASTENAARPRYNRD